MKKIFLLIAGFALVFAVIKYNQPAEENTIITPAPPPSPQVAAPLEIIATGLQIPWDVDFLPDGEILVTERPGNLLVIDQEKKVIKISGVRQTAEGGLMGLAVHPEFSKNRWIYLYITSQSGRGVINRVERYRLENNDLSERTVIIDNIPGSEVHDGGQIEFGPPTPAGSGQVEHYLYISNGDAGNQSLAQDKNSLAGKILRLRDDGSLPADNPFGNAVYSMGHRNPQGLAWDSSGRLWSTEHGPSGLQTGHDELNLVEKGKNYGWPLVRGDEERAGMTKPFIHSGASETWAPAGLAFHNGKLYFAGLRGQTLYAADSQNAAAGLQKFFMKTYGRLRAVKSSAEGLYFTTSNRDGRGQPKDGDDKLILVRDPGALK
ncbi:MAG: hypothetical protein A3C85_01455 [Candidatus Doudnabacteria bacterium RIFCSPHIGHO2_02_FULL_48_21]|uniref:Glucose/Sorbosone dehydrogenase domain-containing protein n=1 Tax=Candidatus Doudnabacteria bacterium RIFCSPLOWO2_02_FULL_48_13 TaxID=1817845 RepID=A0A1F5Q8V5_9BACT|nr:MAG: hypothetical protein A3K05_03075 [Candidatus Doudnabacteria bacterium RIFCSPHIGHO2_01_48_18]OGE79816.1 MAG: hypothetical protein A2668_02760 [Candidatus Doudnabacteria bacterium RIFCSPHIGHO2_01_FULL_48_180]OGE90930.1 MAG: hypothetical protein A3F44_03190 [Candidatus Doudnabacteria bacterium RIFCSPHIGHO2_12_FULL_47_25]OGE93950.1 MAG: hypothetical protein A3C85_01455 [Candidatus Doudnabacteria bacterium RIFCSPHIGHO2_02_FULL_48_21]OGE97212.1 MAG: hypothetical protein A3A83_03875 [Candidatu